jgi:DNA-binding NtrC family response regulator
MARPDGGRGYSPISSLKILSVSPAEDDHSQLRTFLELKSAVQQPGIRWLLKAAVNLEGAVTALQNDSVGIVVCESNLLPGTWKDVLEQVAAHPQPPLLIVTSRLADEYLWVDALHHGAYDVLRKPFDPDELSRVLTKACHTWAHRHRGR